MDIDENLFLNFVPVICIGILTLVACVTVFYKLRNRWPVKVNCWFCNRTAKVWRQSLDWWFCPHCEQYNGFSVDGDYNYDIPEQHVINNKNISKFKTYCQKKDFFKSQNSLCKQCNKKEELKLLKLRELEDSIDVNNDKQIARYERSFEKKYPLCLNCQNNVQNILHRQALWLTQHKMLLFKQKPIRKIIENRERIVRFLRFILSILALVSIYFTEVWHFPLCGVLIQIATCLASSTNKRQSDIFPILGWTCLLWVRAFSIDTILKMFKIYFNDDHTSIDDNTYQYFNITLGTSIALANFKSQSRQTISNGSIAFKKLDSTNNSISISRSSTPDTTVLKHESTCKSDPPRNLSLPINITDTLMTSTTVETPIPLKPKSVSEWSLNDSKPSQTNHSTLRASPRDSLLEGENSFSQNLSSQNYNLNDSLTSLNSLSLGNQTKISPSQSPRVFETKTYSTKSPDIFSKYHRTSQRQRSILAPAKLRSVTQTSWVAGGYWQSGMDAPTLSRSSSQSSGFGSSGSNCGPSREPSLHEFDQCSVVSDQCFFARPESPLSSRNSTIVKRLSNNSTPRLPQGGEVVYGGGELVKYHMPSGVTQCSGHTTIVTNPSWLPALLCGSLVFNMIVVCAILLR